MFSMQRSVDNILITVKLNVDNTQTSTKGTYKETLTQMEMVPETRKDSTLTSSKM